MDAVRKIIYADRSAEPTYFPSRPLTDEEIQTLWAGLDILGTDLRAREEYILKYFRMAHENPEITIKLYLKLADTRMKMGMPREPVAWSLNWARVLLSQWEATGHLQVMYKLEYALGRLENMFIRLYVAVEGRAWRQERALWGPQ